MLDLDHIQCAWSLLTGSLAATETDASLPVLFDPYTISSDRNKCLICARRHGNWKSLSK